MKKTEELKKQRTLSAENLKSEIIKVRKELSILRLEVQANKVQNFAKVGVLRKNIARLHTLENNGEGVNK